jgi:hypothetical protein
VDGEGQSGALPVSCTNPKRANMTKKDTKNADETDFAQEFFKEIVQNLRVDDEKVEGKGVPYQFRPFGILMIRHAGKRNKAYIKMLAEKMTPYINAVGQIQNLAEDAARRMTAEIFAETIIVGLSKPDGTPVAYGKKEKAMFVDAFLQLPEEFEKLQEAAANLANFRIDKLKAIAKN